MEYSTPEKSARQHASKLVRDAVIFYGRAVRLEDLRTFAKNEPAEFYERLSGTLGNLVYEGKIYIAKQGRRDKYGGCFYLPTDIRGEHFTENLPLSWLDIVEQSFRELWRDKTMEAKAKGELLVPPLTGDVKKYILAQFGEDVFPEDKASVSYALAYLCRTKPEPVLKKLRHGSSRKIFWLPATALPNDYCLDKQNKSKSEQGLMMIKAAIAKLGRPATADEIGSAIALSEGKSKGQYVSFNELTNNTAHSLLRRVGFVAGEWYYYYGEITDEESTVFLTAQRCYLNWIQFDAALELETIHLCKLPTVAYGRLLLIKQTARRIKDDLKKISNNREVCQKFCVFLDDLFMDIEKIIVETELRLSYLNVSRWNLPPNIVQQTAMLDSEQLSNLLKPILNVARKYKFDHKVSDVIGRRLKKHINPDYTPYFPGTSRFNLMSRYLYDRCDVMIYTGNYVGASFCRMLAGMAKVEMGSLRDSRFIVPMLKSENFEHRIGVIACLAFLQIPEQDAILFQTALNDSDPGVRQAALWAYAFRKNSDLQDLIHKINQNENNKNVIGLTCRLSKEIALSV